MSECRALTNVIGNSVATVVVANWEKQLDKKQLEYCSESPQLKLRKTGSLDKKYKNMIY